MNESDKIIVTLCTLLHRELVDTGKGEHLAMRRRLNELKNNIEAEGDS